MKKGRSYAIVAVAALTASLLLPPARKTLAASRVMDLAEHPEDARFYGGSAWELSESMPRPFTAHGDINGDGLNDLIISHDQGSKPPEGTFDGKAYLYFGRPGLSGEIDLGADADLIVTGRDWSYGFFSLACGDLNGDGLDDILLGAPYDSSAGPLAGGGMVIFGREDYSFLPGSTWDLDLRPPDLTVSAGVSAESSGYSLACGDLNGDGLDDMVLGAYSGNGGVHRYDGNTWRSEVGGFSDNLWSIYMYPPGRGWAVGPYTKDWTTLYFFDGNSWYPRDSGFKNKDVDLRAVHGLDASHVWAVGEGGTVIRWDGSSWTQLDCGVQADLYGVAALDPTHLWAVGEGGIILFSSDGGSTWDRQGSGVIVTLRSVTVVNDSCAWAVGDGGTVLYWDGGTWTRQAQGLTDQDLLAVDAFSGLSAWAVGRKGTVLHYDGFSWKLQSSGTLNELRGITACASSEAWACGTYGTLLHYGGGGWDPRPQSFTNHLNALCDLGPGAVWEAGDAFTGRAYVAFGRSSLPSLLEPDVTVNGIDTYDSAGIAVGCGDFNGDGTADLMVAANDAAGPGNARPYCGEAYLVYGRDTWPEVIDLCHQADVTIYGADPYDHLLSWVQSPAPDFNGDGTDDLLIPLPQADGPDNLLGGCGEVLVVHGGDLPRVVDLATRSPDIVFHGGRQGAGFGQACWALDFNGDGLLDLAVTSTSLGIPPERVANGVTCLLNGREAWPGTVDIEAEAVLLVEGALDSDVAGLAVSGANLHSANPHDYQDLVISSRAAGPGGSRPRCGEHYVILGYDNVSPYCSLLSPAEEEVLKGEVKVEAEAEDFFGVERVEFLVDGKLRHTDYQAPYAWDWDTLGMEDGGEHLVTARAWDAHGNAGEDSVTVRILNALPSPSPLWYLAEGSTAWGFEEWVLVQNPNQTEAVVEMEFMLPDGRVVPVDPPLGLPPTSRRTVDVSAYVGQADVSTLVRADRPVICERAMYWDDRSEGHCSVGATVPSPLWYLAEGSTAWGFEEWVLIQNPGEQQALVNVEFMKGDGTVVPYGVAVSPRSRHTIHVNEVPGCGNADLSTRLVSDQPIICERAMYRFGRAVGHGTVGTPALSRTWYLAEGSTAWGFEEYVLIQNPGEQQALVNVEFMKGDGTVVPYGVAVSPRSRHTIHVNEVPGCGNADLSTRLVSDQPIICERAMYWNGVSAPAGHATLGTPMPLRRWYLAEGSTAWGFEEWVLVQNPNQGPCEVTYSFMLPDGSQVQRTFPVRGRSRFTVRVNDLVPESDVSTEVRATLPIIAERAMYWKGGDGGHCTVGAWSP